MEFLTTPITDHVAATAAGYVFVIRCEPDPFTGERLNIGVCVQEAGGKRWVRCIEEPGRLECLYGTGALSIVNLAKLAAACAAQGLPSPSQQIIFDTPLPYYHSKAEDMLRVTYQEQVTVALPQRVKAERMQLDDAAATTMVINELRKMLPMLGEVVANTPITLLQTPQGQRPVTVPLQPRNGVGAVRSADYSPASLKSHLMDSVLDLQCAALYRKRKHQAIFLLRPTQEPSKLARQRDDVIDSVMYRASALQLFQSSSSESLAHDVAAWAKEAG